MYLTLRSLAPLILMAMLSGCTGNDAASLQSLTGTPSSNENTPRVSPASPSPAATMFDQCVTTIANEDIPPNERASDTASGYHGNGALWTALWPDGIVKATEDHIRPDGSIEMKFPWWRGPGVVGNLQIAGRRLDAVAPPLKASVPDGYGEAGFQATTITFPTEGCWEITGQADGRTLTFITLVVKATNP